MHNYVQEGKNLTLTAPYAVDSGDGAQVGNYLFGVACGKYESGATGVFTTEGVFTLPKDGSAFIPGDLVAWNNSSKVVQESASGGMVIGVAVSTANGAATEVNVRLNGAFGV